MYSEHMFSSVYNEYQNPLRKPTEAEMHGSKKHFVLTLHPQFLLSVSEPFTKKGLDCIHCLTAYQEALTSLRPFY